MQPKKTNYKPAIITGSIVYVICCYFIVQLCAYATAYPRDNFAEIFNRSVEGILGNPFTIPAIPTNSLLWITVFSLAFGLAIAYMWSTAQRDKHAKSMTESGTAEWNTDLDRWNKKYTDPKDSTDKNGKRNMILTQDVYLSMNTRQTRRNNNVLVIGGSGAGKSRFFVKPNLCEMPLNCNFICTDPSGELLKESGLMLENAGYKIKVFNLVNMKESDRYNPLNYIHEENDVILLVDCILANTTDPNKKGGDDFWEKAQKLMLQAFIFLIWLHGDDLRLEKNLSTVVKLMDGCQINEEDSTTENETDLYFKAVHTEGWYFDDTGKFNIGKPQGEKEQLYKYYEPIGSDICIKQYTKFKTGAGKTLKSILISAMARLSTLDSDTVANLLSTDDIALNKIGDEKTALFVIIPQEHESFNFLAAMLYTQLFQSLYYHAENECQGNYLIVDANGENVKAFEIPRVQEEIGFIDDIEEEEVDFAALKAKKDNSAKDGKSKKSFFNLFKYAGQKKELEATNAKETDEKVSDEDKLIPDDNPGEEDKSVEQLANDFCERAKNVYCMKKGNKFIIKMPADTNGNKSADDEIIGIYSDAGFAEKKVLAIKNGCKVIRCGLFLPYHVRFILDEFANIGQIPDFTKKLATMRKYEISCSVILQNLAQIKNMYKDDWGSIVGNCDSFLFLGCPEYDTLEYVSKMLGKQTIRVRNDSVSRGGKGSSSLSYQKTARDLATPDELRRLDDSECVYVLRGEQPFKGKKHQFVNHPNYKYTADADANNIFRFRKIADRVIVDRISTSSQSEADAGNINDLSETEQFKRELNESSNTRQALSEARANARKATNRAINYCDSEGRPLVQEIKPEDSNYNHILHKMSAGFIPESFGFTYDESETAEYDDTTGNGEVNDTLTESLDDASSINIFGASA